MRTGGSTCCFALRVEIEVEIPVIAFVTVSRLGHRRHHLPTVEFPAKSEAVTVQNHPG